MSLWIQRGAYFSWSPSVTEPTKVMTAAANGATYEQCVQSGWTDEQLVEHGLMEPRATGHDTATDDRLRNIIERVERLDEEIKNIRDDRKDVLAEAKAVGYDTKIIGQIIKLRTMKPDDRAEMEMMLDTYKCALGMG